MNFITFLIEGGGAYMQYDKGASDRVFELSEIRAMQKLALKHHRDFDHHDTMAEIGPDEYDTHFQVHMDIRKDLSKREPGKKFYTVDETVYSGSDDEDHQEHAGNTFRTDNFDEFIKKLDELLS